MHRTRVDYTLCNVLYSLSSILENFPCGQMQDEINQTLSLIQNRCLNVAIIGEFRRGKSSLINALLGMPVLPVDIEPTTAAINRITYGLKPRAVVHFKDGRSTEVPIQELSSYVTKLTPSSAELAATVKEAEIQYPTELCSNHIDIIDTPGLNDTESMTAVTESMLDDIHIAVITVKSTMPYSETECHWVAKLLALPKLNHIVFVLTCMDLVRRQDVQKLLEYTRHRICEKTLECVRLRYKDAPEIMLRAEHLFSEDRFVLYPVSAALALEAFETGSYELLTESNISSLKKGLLTTMSAQQQMVGLYETERLIQRFADLFSYDSPQPYTEELAQLMEDLACADAHVGAYFEERSSMIDDTMKQINLEIEKQVLTGLSKERLVGLMQKICIKHLSAVTVNENEEIALAMHNAEANIWENVLWPLENDLRKTVNATIIRNVNVFLLSREHRLHYEENQKLIGGTVLPSSEDLKKRIVNNLQQGLKVILPKFSTESIQIALNQNIMHTQIIPCITSFVERYREAWKNALPEYTQTWYSIVLHAEPMELHDKFRNLTYSRKGAASEKISFLNAQYQKAKLRIEEEKKRISQLKEELFV